ncbi:hypothetical protein B0T12DRAFT_478590 [Alternaria alternata]|nr:hypothetical protein B0T12DRAFT_478590 [Alternaria alternata]OWY43147.1 hypothetical protein AALT_g663 [Alternaria alternata]
MHTGPKSEFERQLLDSTTPEARAFSYTNGLGFRKSSTRPDTNRGRPKFLGIVGDFHDATQAVVDQIAVKYKSHIDLKETIANSPPGFKDEDIEACLKEWGPGNWTNGRDGTPFVTSIDTKDGNYPNHLRYGNKNDRNLIKMLVYCWIIFRAYKKMELKPAPNTTNATSQAQAGRKDETSERPRSLAHLCVKLTTVGFAIFGFAMFVFAILVIFV